MKKPILVLWVVLVVTHLSSVFTDSAQKLSIAKLEKATRSLSIQLEELRVARKLESRKVWYFVGPGGIVSSEPHGKGQIVAFDAPFLNQRKASPYGTTVRDSDLYNKRFSFHTPKDTGNSDTRVCGGLLEMIEVSAN